MLTRLCLYLMSCVCALSLRKCVIQLMMFVPYLHILTGDMDAYGRVDRKSMIANILVYVFFAYLRFGAALWLISDNILKTVHDTEKSHSHYNNAAQWFDLLFAEIKGYFLPHFHFYYPFALASIFQNLLTLVDIFTFMLRLIRDLVKKYRIGSNDRPKQNLKNKWNKVRGLTSVAS